MTEANELSRAAWEANAAFWDERMDEGNDHVEELLWPAIGRLAAVQPGTRLLDVGCGNGLIARRLAAAGAAVVAFDFSAALIKRAHKRGERTFDGAVSNMALMDMAEVAPLYRALARLLRPGAAFVFSVMHPAFNGAGIRFAAEMHEDNSGRPAVEHSVRLSDYLSERLTLGVAIQGQPEPQPYFHRPLHALLRPAFEAGFVLDALEEPAFEHPSDDPRRVGWRNVPGIPHGLVCRLRLPA